MKRALITGGSGYLGRHLLRTIPPAWEAHFTYHEHAPDAPGGGIAHALDIRDEARVNRLVRDLSPHVVIHTAYSMAPALLDSVTVAGTHHVVDAAARAGARLVHLSSDVMFDGEQAPYTEAAAPSPITPYGQAKAAAEASAATHPNAAIIRTSLIFGFDPPEQRTCWILDSLRQGQPLTLFTDEYRCPVYAMELAAAAWELALGDYCGILNVAGAQALSRYEFGVLLARAWHVDPAGITPGLSQGSGQVRPRDCRLDISLARRILHTPLSGAEAVLDEFRQTGYSTTRHQKIGGDT
ncbi:MAG: sugar nucleotide-binding protein [Chloroflexi bacterium]|nr:sugar nucleotide-binding protein [Chloroflexota bacterium]MBU1751752.1 sugar nucleotide-binding protein [Chloroflexota bacterium]MBU1877576.1 sugar nucleotide-binding protein [Chloroflexota bacterium]